MNELKQKYQQELAKDLMKDLKLVNPMAVPTVKKVVLNMGVAQPQDPRERKKIIDGIMEQFKIISGQQPAMTVARKSIANFKLRAGDPLGVMVTLRGEYMWEFLQKLISVALPRVKDFRGVPRVAFDGQGNYSLGINEQIIFPEIDYDKIDRIRSLQVTIVTSTDQDAQAFALLEKLGIPFEKAEN